MIKFHIYDKSSYRTDFIEMNRDYLNEIRDECLSYFNLDMVDTVGLIDDYVENSMPDFESLVPPEVLYISSLSMEKL